MKYKKYPSYKDSGVEWLGEVPEHWEITRLGNISNITASGIDKKINEDEEKVKIINFTDIHKAKNFILDNAKEYMLVSTPLERKNKHQVKKGDLIFTPSSETIEDIGISALVNEELLNTSYSYHVLRCNFTTVVNHEYKKYLTNNTYCLAQFSSKARGTTRQTLSRDDFRTLYLSLPPIQEQQQIAKFLDNATQKMDTLIQKQEKLIKLLKEKRQAVISHAVTRGLNPDVKFKDSGVEWLGDVPEHWNLSKGKYIGKILSTPSLSEDEINRNGDLAYIKVNDLNYIDNKLRLYKSIHKTNFTNINIRPIKDFICFPKRGAAIFTNKACIVKIHAMIDPNLMGWKINKNFNIKYILHLLLNRGLVDIADISTVPQINNKHIEPIEFPNPPIEEQLAIVNHIENKTSKLDTLIKKATKSIKLLKEKRTALISTAVTGKIDVRELN